MNRRKGMKFKYLVRKTMTRRTRILKEADALIKEYTYTLADEGRQIDEQEKKEAALV